jgi:hypothetical protein
MRARNRSAETTLIAELDLRRVGDRHSEFVLITYDRRGARSTSGRLAAALGCELIAPSPTPDAADCESGSDAQED